jgi:hypothetical protein
MRRGWWIGIVPLLILGCHDKAALEKGMQHPVSLAAPAVAQQAREIRVIVWSTDETYSLEAFEKAAARAKAAGATHMVINDNVPRAKWEYEAAGGIQGDPYPAWYDYRPGILKIFTPEALRKHVPAAFSAQVAEVLEKRSAILRRHGLKGLFQCNEPQVLPETVYAEHPLWRGPRVDQPNRSKLPHFAPSVDEAEVLALYREALAEMLKRCPEIDMLRLVTTDAGSGFSWAAGLYPGPNGPAKTKNRPMAERVRGFVEALQAGARNGGASGTFEVRIVPIEPEEWMIPTFEDPAALARQMPPGTAIGNTEIAGGAAGAYMSAVGWSNPAITSFYPVRGVPNPAEALAGLRAAYAGSAPRLTFNAPRGYDDLYGRLLELVRAQPPKTAVEEAAILQKLAETEVGTEHAEKLVQVWQAIAKANDFGTQLKFAYPTVFGGVHQRWLARPFVPFPEALAPEEKAAWRPYLLSAKSEAQADDLADMQAMHLFEGWSGRMWVLNVFNRVEPEINKARTRLAVLKTSAGAKRAELELLDRKLQAALLLCGNARNAVNYQAALDYIKTRKAPVDADPPLGARESWDRQMILEVARAEIDNTAALLELLKSSPVPLLDLAATPEGEDVTLLGPNLQALLKKKIDVMNAHWQDYNRLTTAPNQ